MRTGMTALTQPNCRVSCPHFIPTRRLKKNSIGSDNRSGADCKHLTTPEENRGIRADYDVVLEYHSFSGLCGGRGTGVRAADGDSVKHPNAGTDTRRLVHDRARGRMWHKQPGADGLWCPIDTY